MVYPQIFNIRKEAFSYKKASFLLAFYELFLSNKIFKITAISAFFVGIR